MVNTVFDSWHKLIRELITFLQVSDKSEKIADPLDDPTSQEKVSKTLVTGSKEKLEIHKRY